MFSSQRTTGLGVLVLLLIGLGIWGLKQCSGDPLERPQDSAHADEAGQEHAGIPSGPDDPIPQGPEAHARATLADHFAKLSGVSNPAEARRLLEVLQSWLDELPAELAAAIIREFISTGTDTNLPLEFSVGDDGLLTTPPTFRVALMDILASINPPAAASLGRETLSTPTTADEWAVSLRNVARVETNDDTRRYLQNKAEELVRNAAWQSKPSIGFLNAFDVFVHTRAVTSTPLLSELIQRKDRRDLAHAAFLTIDRLTQLETAAMLEQFRNDRALQQSRPEMVAQQFARADLRNNAQRELVRSWLLDPERTQNELGAFAGIFPNSNQMVSNNLLTPKPQLSQTELMAHDKDTLTLVRQWQNDPSFAKILPHLDTMARRLQQFSSGTDGAQPP